MREPGDYRAPNGVLYRIAGPATADANTPDNREPLLLLHGLMVSGAMFDPLIARLQPDFGMIVPDLRGHGRSGEMAGPYDVPALAEDLGAVLEDALQVGAARCAVLGYSHGGAVALELAHARPAAVSRLMLVATYACNVATPRERLEAAVMDALLGALTPGQLAALVVRGSGPKPGGGEIGATRAQAAWLRGLMAQNRRAPMRAAAHGLVTFDARPWLADITAPTLVVGGTHDAGVPMHHYDMLLAGIPQARGRLIERAGHMLAWTHTAELEQIVRGELAG
jgi:pimeloyl-ACP methyl ester carboxylesterase